MQIRKIKIGMNRNMNKYLEFEVESLLKHRPKSCRDMGDPVKFWGTAERLMNSWVYIIVSLGRVVPQWHRHESLSRIVKTAKAVKLMTRNKPINLDYKRVYIPKGNQPNSWRPLGVPTLEWRVYLHMWNNIFSIYLENLLPTSQHGFRPKKGTLSAWREILEKVVNKKNIWEFDLKQFFDTVDLVALKQQMQIYKFPDSIVEQFYKIHQCHPQLPAEELLDESHTRYGDPDGPWKMGLTGAKVYDGLHPKALWAQGPPGSMRRPLSGVPQGAPTSPLLSLILLTDSVMTLSEQTTMYADDGNLASDLPIHLPKANQFNAEYGINFHPDKCSWIKKDGEWLKPLKFLGLTYNGTTDTLSASTRKGSTIEVPQFVKAYMVAKDHPLLPRLLNCRTNKKAIDSDSPEFLMEGFQQIYVDSLTSGISWEYLSKSTAMGFVMSRLYQGNFNLDKVKQNFELTMTPKSWVSWHNKAKDFSLVRRTWWHEEPFTRKRPKVESYVEMDIFNSSSFAASSLLSILSRWVIPNSKKSPAKKSLKGVNLTQEAQNSKTQWPATLSANYKPNYKSKELNTTLLRLKKITEGWY